MSSTTISEAINFSNADVTARYHFQNRPVAQLFEILPMEPIDGHQRTVNRVDGSTIQDHATLVTANGAAIATTLPTFSTRESRLSHFAARLEIDTLLADEYSSHRDLVRAQLDVKVAALLAKFQSQIFNGDATQDGEFDGLVRLTNGLDVGATGTGGAIGNGDIELALSLLSPAGGLQGRYLVMHSATYAHLYRHGYSHQIFVLHHPELGPLPAISGVPILLDDYVPQNQGGSADRTSIFAVNIGKDRGLCGLYPARNAGRELLIRGPFAMESTDKLYYDLTAQFGLTVYQEPAVTAVVEIKYGI